jgi:hypothetical protein
MPDSLPTNPARASEPTDDTGREARIEQLLLTGLDHYFAGQYERAISVWTRVVFLERHHDRARAYIERARSALAERHRQSEEFLHEGVTAYNSGDVETARDRLTRAVEQGSDTAHVFLDRLNRIGSPAVGRVLSVTPRSAASHEREARLPPRRGGWVAAGVIALFVAATMLLGGLPIGAWLSELDGAPPVELTHAVSDGPLPVVREAEVALARARTLHEKGSLREALSALDRIGIADPLRSEADRLRADLQRELLAKAGLPMLAESETGRRP